MYNLYKKIKFLGITTSNVELKNIGKAWAAISLAFAILFAGISNQLPIAFLISALTVGTAFLLHELAHKIVAQKFGAFAEFRSDDKMLLFAILLSFTGFIFAVPGAVMISGNITRTQNGKISLAGPLMNFILALIFLTINLITPNIISNYGFTINAWLGLFNLIPFGNFDGRKIKTWNQNIWLAMIITGIILLLI